VKFRTFLGQFSRKIVSLTYIVFEVVQLEVAIIEELKQFPVTFANGDLI